MQFLGADRFRLRLEAARLKKARISIGGGFILVRRNSSVRLGVGVQS